MGANIAVNTPTSSSWQKCFNFEDNVLPRYLSSRQKYVCPEDGDNLPPCFGAHLSDHTVS
jgi:hypothetical protein